jgi:type IV pilus assembly protein PilM
MLGLVQSWFAPTGNPIGVDFGSDSLRMAQVEPADGEYRLVAAASADVPSPIRQDPSARLNFFADTIRDLLASGNFRGRRAILSLPAASTFIQHLRMPKLEEEDLRKALPWEARGKLPIDPTHAVLRHIVAGEIYQEQEQKNEVILMAASRELVNQLLAAAARAKLDVVGMNVEAKAIVDCFTQIYRRKSDAEATTCYVDIGSSGTRVVISKGAQILFARSIPIGGEHFNRAVANGLKINLEDARVLRIKLCTMQAEAGHAGHAQAGHAKAAGHQGPPPEQQFMSRPKPAARPRQAEESESLESAFPLLGAAMAKAGAQGQGHGQVQRPAHGQAQPHPAATARAEARLQHAPHFDGNSELVDKAARVDQALRDPLAKLTEELDLCRRYHESTFHSVPLDRLVFVGGEARHRGLCQNIARSMSLAATIGDPLVRMGRTSDVGVESGIDRRQPQPSWSVAVGLSMGPAGGAAADKSMNEGKK